jgi:hypothetical protein
VKPLYSTAASKILVGFRAPFNNPDNIEKVYTGMRAKDAPS